MLCRWFVRLTAGHRQPDPIRFKLHQAVRRVARRTPAARAALIALLAVALAPPPALAAWSGGSELLSSGGQVPWAGPVVGMVEAWRVALDSPLISDPVVDAQGTTVVADQVGLTAFGPDGAELWTRPMPAIRPGSVTLMEREQEASLVIALTTSPRAIKAVSAVSGDVAWSTTLAASPGSPPLVGSDGRLYLVTTDGRLRVFSHDGVALWGYFLDDVVSLPLARGPGGLIYALQDNGTMTAIDPVRRTAVWRCNTRLIPARGPSVGTDGALYVVAATGYAARVNPTGTLGWSIPLAAAAPPLTTADGGSVHLSTGGLLRHLSETSTTLWSVDLAGRSSTVQPVIDSDGVIHVAAGDTLCRVTMQGALLSPAAIIAGEQILSAAMPGPEEAIVVTDAGMLYCLRGPLAPDQPPAGDDLDWLPDLEVSEPDGQGGWYRQPPQISAASASVAVWPAGREIYWAATAGDTSQAGVLTRDANVFAIDLQGQVSLVLRQGGSSLTGEATAQFQIDRTPPVITLDGAVGDRCTVPPGEYAPAVACQDNGSGVAQCTTMLDGEPFTGPQLLATGRYTMLVRCVDYAGNQAEHSYQLNVANRCGALSLNPILASSVPGRTPAWSSWVTILIRLPRDLAALQAPETPVLAGVQGQIVARLPVSASSDSRTYLARFDRSAVVDAILSQVGQAQGHLVPVPLELLVHLGPDLFSAEVKILWRR